MEPPPATNTGEIRHLVQTATNTGEHWVLTTRTIVRRREIPAQGDWPKRLRARCIEVGYGDVLIGQCDVEGIGTDGAGFCGNPHKNGPKMHDNPAIWEILDEIGVPRASASCHWVGLDRQRMTPEQRKAVEGRRYWVCERWRDEHLRGCPHLSNRYEKCTCPGEPRHGR